MSAVKSTEDHAIIGWLCLPTAGVIGAAKMDFFITFVVNFLSHHPKNGIVLIVHSNRASQMKSSPKEKMERNSMGSWEHSFTATLLHMKIIKKHVNTSLVFWWTQFRTKNHNLTRRTDAKDECTTKTEIKKDEESSDGESDTEKDIEAAEVRDVKHMLETLFHWLWSFFGTQLSKSNETV